MVNEIEDASGWLEAGGEAQQSHDGKQMQFVMLQGELTPELKAMKERMENWTPEQWRQVNAYLRSKYPDMPPQPTAPR